MSRHCVSFLGDIPVLRGSLVRLEPLSAAHRGDLAAAAEENRGSYAFTEVPRATGIDAYLAAHSARADAGRMAPFAQVRQSDGRAVGCTSYWDPRYWPGRADLCAVEIGWTWLAASAQRTGINTEAKLLLMERNRPGSAGCGSGAAAGPGPGERGRRRSGPGWAPSR